MRTVILEYTKVTRVTRQSRKSGQAVKVGV